MTANAEQLHVLVAGGGVAALEAALALRTLASDKVSVELLAPEREFVYRAQAVAEPFGAGESRRFPLDHLVEAAGATLRRGLLASVDVDAKRVSTDDATVAYDALLVAVGARPSEALAGALTFRGAEDSGVVSGVLDELVRGDVKRVAFAIPAGASWPLPVYELALLTHNYLDDHGTRNVELTIVTPEERPLAAFGHAASDAMRDLLEIRGIALRAGAPPKSFDGARLVLAQGDDVAADRVLALPRLTGPAVEGLPRDGMGFIPADEYARVVPDAAVYAAGDGTTYPIKQGGIATQQADVAAASIAQSAGAPVEATPFRPVLRGLLLTGMVPRYLRADPRGGSSVVDTQPLWWPPGKIVGRYLAPFLAETLGLSEYAREPAAGIAVDVDLEHLARDRVTHVSV